MATDPRDHIYGLLAIADDADVLGIELDYGKEARDVFVDFAMTYLKRGDLDLMACSQVPKLLPRLPSWVPDWTGSIAARPETEFEPSLRQNTYGETKARVLFLSGASNRDSGLIAGQPIPASTASVSARSSTRELGGMTPGWQTPEIFSWRCAFCTISSLSCRITRTAMLRGATNPALCLEFPLKGPFSCDHPVRTRPMRVWRRLRFPGPQMMRICSSCRYRSLRWGNYGRSCAKWSISMAQSGLLLMAVKDMASWMTPS